MAGSDVNSLLTRLLGLSKPGAPAHPASEALGSLASGGSQPGVPVSGEAGSSPGALLRGIAVAAAGTPGSSDVAEDLARQLNELTRTAQLQTKSLEQNTSAVIENSVVTASGGQGSKAGSIAKTVLSFLGGGFGLVQLVGGLFGGTDAETAPAAVTYAPPSPVQADLGLLTASPALQSVRYGQDGLPRTTAPAPARPEVTIQVQAMDSRSFLDHSDEIAQAVRTALLNSHTLNDVVAEL